MELEYWITHHKSWIKLWNIISWNLKIHSLEQNTYYEQYSLLK